MHEYVACVVSSSSDVSSKYRSPGENGETQDEKIIGETVYKMPSIHFSFLSFHQHFLVI